jgi:hypothetical protein
LKPQLGDELDDLKRYIVVMTRMLDRLRVEKSESIPRRSHRREGSEVDLPMDPPVAAGAQAVNPSRGVGAGDPDPIGGEDSERGSTVVRRKVRETVFGGPVIRRSPEPARYAYGAWTIRRTITTTYLIEKAPASQPELKKIAQKHQPTSNLSSLVALPLGARKAVDKFLNLRKSSEASLVAMEPLKK